MARGCRVSVSLFCEAEGRGGDVRPGLARLFEVACGPVCVCAMFGTLGSVVPPSCVYRSLVASSVVASSGSI